MTVDSNAAMPSAAPLGLVRIIFDSFMSHDKKLEIHIQTMERIEIGTFGNRIVCPVKVHESSICQIRKAQVGMVD